MARPKQQLIVEVRISPTSDWEQLGTCNTEVEATKLLKEHSEEAEFRILLVKKTGKLEVVKRLDVIFDEASD